MPVVVVLDPLTDFDPDGLLRGQHPFAGYPRLLGTHANQDCLVGALQTNMAR
jgi:hypothetical protein